MKVIQKAKYLGLFAFGVVTGTVAMYATASASTNTASATPQTYGVFTAHSISLWPAAAGDSAQLLAPVNGTPNEWTLEIQGGTHVTDMTYSVCNGSKLTTYQSLPGQDAIASQGLLLRVTSMPVKNLPGHDKIGGWFTFNVIPHDSGLFYGDVWQNVSKTSGTC